MPAEHLYVVTYDISDPKRWSRVYKLMHGYGQWLQLSVFQCRLTVRRRVELSARLEEEIMHGVDSVFIFDIGPADSADSRVECLGKTFRRIERIP